MAEKKYTALEDVRGRVAILEEEVRGLRELVAAMVATESLRGGALEHNHRLFVERIRARSGGETT